jgi:reversibly glycosylated polypeptide / UDP-arabinopyranose mutase
MKKILVVPSIREECFKNFIKAWDELGDWDEVILVEDNPEQTFDLRSDRKFYDIGFNHYSWKEIKECTGENSWIFSKRDSAIRSFGFYVAYNNGADYILTLDDDCYPHDSEPIFQRHIDVMNSYNKWTTSCGRQRTRGLPYKNLGRLASVVANMGLWTNIPDFDAVQSLSIPSEMNGQFHPNINGQNKLIPQGQYFPLCGMSFCFKREVAPLAYFPLMGQDQPYSRFDDIWFGIIFKKIIDHLGWNVSVGEPFVNHQKASNVFTNLKKEAPGIEANEHYWSIIDNKVLTKDNPKECMIELGSKLEGDYDIYIDKLGKAMQIWANMF